MTHDFVETTLIPGIIISLMVIIYVPSLIFMWHLIMGEMSPDAASRKTDAFLKRVKVWMFWPFRKLLQFLIWVPIVGDIILLAQVIAEDQHGTTG